MVTPIRTNSIERELSVSWSAEVILHVTAGLLAFSFISNTFISNNKLKFGHQERKILENTVAFYTLR